MDERFRRVDEGFGALGWRFDSLDVRLTAATSDIRASLEHELRLQTMTMMSGMVQRGADHGGSGLRPGTPHLTP